MNHKTIVSAFVAAMVLLAAVSGGALAAPTVTTDSDLEDEDHFYLDPSSDEIETVQFETTNANTDSVTVTISDNSTGTQLAQLTDLDEDLSEVSTDVWEANFTHTELANETEQDVGETYELEIVIEHDHDDTNDGTIETATTTIGADATLVSTEDQSTVLVSDVADLALDLDVEDASDGFLGVFEEDFDTYEATNNHPNGHYEYNETTYVLADDVADAFDAAAEDTDDGDLVFGATVLVQGELVPTYANEEGDLHDSGDAYAVYDTETSELTVELGEDREDAFATDVTIVNNNPISVTSFGDAYDAFDLTTAISLSIPWV